MSKMKRKGILNRLAVCAVSLTMLASSTACGKPDDVGGKVAVICKNEKVSFWEEVKTGASDCCDEMGYEMLYYVASSDNDFASQIEYINDAIDKGVKAIIIAPNDPNELNDALSKIQDENRFYSQELYAKYIRNTGANIFLNSVESKWLLKHGSIRVGYLDNYLAYCEKDKETGKLTGALKDYLQKASDCFANAHIEFETKPF